MMVEMVVEHGRCRLNLTTIWRIEASAVVSFNFTNSQRLADLGRDKAEGEPNALVDGLNAEKLIPNINERVARKRR